VQPGQVAVFCNAAPGCRSVWYRPRHEPALLVLAVALEDGGDVLGCDAAEVEVKLWPPDRWALRR
jgi:hypothetical protein